MGRPHALVALGRALDPRRYVPLLIALALGAFALSFAPAKTFTEGIPLWVPAVLAFLWVALAPLGMMRDNVLPGLAVLVTALGLAQIARLDPELARRQVLWITIALSIVVASGPWLRRFHALAAFKYIWIVGAILAFVAVALFGQEVNGARLWIRLGPMQFEPIEIVKLFVVLFMAAYLAETGDVIAAARPWSLRANAKYLGPLFIGWGTSMAILMLQRDLGMAALLFATFAAMLYVATRRIDLILGGLGVFAMVAAWAANHYHYVATRIAVWRNPFTDPYGAGYQTLQSLFALANGGVFGSGYGLGASRAIPDVATDYIYAAWSGEFGLFGAMALCAVYLVIVERALAVATRQPDLYAKLLATGLAVTLGFQVFIIVGGVLRLFPLTGITLPFFSYGGSSMVANYVLIALIWAISARKVAA